MARTPHPLPAEMPLAVLVLADARQLAWQRAHSTQPNKRTSVTTQAQASSIAFCSEACWTLLCTTHKLWAAASFAEWSSPGNNGCRPIGSHRQGGGGACFFRIHSNGIKNEHWPEFDQTVFLADWAAVVLTTSARSWLTVKIISRHAWVPRKCRGRGSGWNPVPA